LESILQASHQVTQAFHPLQQVEVGLLVAGVPVVLEVNPPHPEDVLDRVADDQKAGGRKLILVLLLQEADEFGQENL
jgi:hypothetical protein